VPHPPIPPIASIAGIEWNLVWLVPGLPLAGALACALLHFWLLRRERGVHGHDAAHSSGAAHAARAPGGLLAYALALGPIAAALALSVAGFLELRGLPAEGPQALASSSWSWIDAGELSIDVALTLDRLSSVMALVITGVGTLIFVYATAYMAHDAGRVKFFAYLNLFAAAMLLLVLASSLVGLFVGWEGVGLCSYLLIGFWYEKGWPAEAGQKAFVANRVGDACFLLGSFVLVGVFGTLDLASIAARAPEALAEHAGAITLACLLLFGGCCGKSAQFPLFTWLPDAMAGPTPVSALIHAATMVTAGIYLVVRLNPLFSASPTALAVIGGVGALTALIGASSALLQRDIKRVLAYSTVSQLGYMFLGLGAGAYGAALFHLVTHAFFKALLFLGAGSVIHGLGGEQDMARMGGLRRHMPLTFLTFLAGAAALSGLPGMAGYFSKDEILASAFAHGGLSRLYWAAGLAGAALTAFYTWRMVALTFFGAGRFDRGQVHPHESPAAMTVPLCVLALLSVAGGMLGLPAVMHAPHVLSEWLAPVVGGGHAVAAADAASAEGAPAQHAAHLSITTEWLLLGGGALVALWFAQLGFRAYRAGPAPDERLRRDNPALAGFLESAWRIDAGYASRVVLPVKLGAFALAALVDQLVIDGAVNGIGILAQGGGAALRKIADGSLKTYALWIGVGGAALALLWGLAG
jgi:NADH-quinone oxidoreductase subunit L